MPYTNGNTEVYGHTELNFGDFISSVCFIYLRTMVVDSFYGVSRF